MLLIIIVPSLGTQGEVTEHSFTWHVDEIQKYQHETDYNQAKSPYIISYQQQMNNIEQQ